MSTHQNSTIDSRGGDLFSRERGPAASVRAWVNQTFEILAVERLRVRISYLAFSCSLAILLFSGQKKAPPFEENSAADLSEKVSACVHIGPRRKPAAESSRGRSTGLGSMRSVKGGLSGRLTKARWAGAGLGAAAGWLGP